MIVLRRGHLTSQGVDGAPGFAATPHPAQESLGHANSDLDGPSIPPPATHKQKHLNLTGPNLATYPRALLAHHWHPTPPNTLTHLLRSSGRTFRSLALDRKLGGSCGITGLGNTVGDNDKDMRNAGGKEEEEDVLKQRRQDRRGDNYTGAGRIQEVKLRDISETGVLLIHFQGAFKLSLKSETYHKVNNEAQVKRGQKSINQWLKPTTLGRIKPQAQSDNPSETRNHTVHEVDPITIQAQAHLDPSGRLPARVTFVIQDISGVDTFTSSGCNPFGVVLLGGAARFSDSISDNPTPQPNQPDQFDPSKT
ncbi:hypothetical protein EDB87DRAFT_1581795 [Lactarius vividus]|nr:hypothetical protein EDB87DRAFT_1581795 [Lactarius vividus]